MPTISPQARVQVGAPDAPTTYRPTIHASTGMSPPKTTTQTTPAGQPGNKEETAAPVVTLSPQLTALARKQQKLQAEIQAQREKESQFEASKSNYIPKDAFKAKMEANAAEALKELGYDYNQITEILLAQQSGDDPFKKLEARIDDLQKNQEQSVNKQYDATIKQYTAEATALIDSDPKAYHFIKKGGHQDAVVQHIVDTWEENPDKVLTVEQAAKEIEAFFREDATEKAAALKELEPQEETPAQKKTLPPPAKAAARTLTSSVETPPQRAYGQFQHLSMKERIAQATARAQR